MALRFFNPIYLLGPPALVVISLPLAFFAAWTTVLALFALTIRASIVYFELATAILQTWLFKSRDRVSYRKPDFSDLRQSASPPVVTRHRRYPSSAAASSNASSQDLTVGKKPLSRRESWASIVGAGSENRDYEGVGGWRITGEDDDDALWVRINSRLELPAAVDRKRKHHTRSLTSTSQRVSGSPEARRSPVQSRARTPTAAAANALQTQEYFDLNPQGNRPDLYPTASAMRARDDRRKSMGASSTSSGSSVKAQKALTKQTSFG